MYITCSDSNRLVNALVMFLKNSPFFVRYNECQVKKFASSFQEVTFIKDSIVLEENEPCSSFFLIVDGFINKYIYDSSKKHDQFVGILEPGDGFCFDSLLKATSSTSTYRGASTGTLLRLDHDVFIKILAEVPRSFLLLLCREAQ